MRNPNLHLLAAAILSLAASPALAAKADAKAPATKDAPAKKDAAGEKKDAAAAKKPEERTGPAGFTGGYELEESQRTVEADKKRDEAIEQLKRIIPRLDAGPQKSELLFQLAELWIEKQKYVYFNEMNAYDVKVRTWSECRDTKTAEQCGKEPREDTHQSELYRDEALRLYDQILKDDPTYPRKDEVLFALATNLYEKGRKRGAERPDLVAQAIAKHRDLITQYPNSKFVGDSYIALGEHFFGANDLTKARKAYEGALESSKDDPRVYNFALYKLAWCDYNGGDFEGSLQKFQKVVDLSEQQKRKNEVALKYEALNDMVLAWQKLEAIEEANAYYKRKSSRKEARRYFSKLANRYYDDGGYDNAIKSFRILINEEPNDPRCPDFQNNIVRSFEGLRQRDKVFEEMKVLVANYKPGSAWAVANKDNKPALESAYAVTEEALRTLVTDYHQEAQKTKEVRTYRLARDIYKEYLDSFGQSEFAYNLNYYYAEILWTLEEWEKASGAYESVYARDASGSYAKTAAYNALLCYEKLVQIDAGQLEKSSLRDDQKVDEKKDKGSFKSKKKIVQDKITKDAKPEQLTKWEQALANSCDRYGEIASKDKRLEKDELNVRYKAAFIYYDRKHFTEAAKRFGDIILKWPTDDQAQKAADLSLNILEIREEWYELARLSRAFYENKKLAKPGAKWTTDLAKIMEGAQYKYIDLVVYKEEKKTEQAATMFRDFVKEFPKSEYAAQALRYSLIVFNEAKKLDQAIEVGEQILAQYGDSKFRSDTIWDLAKFYQLTSNFTKAAGFYEQYYTEWEQKEGVRAPTPDPKAKKPAKVQLKSYADVIKAKQKEALQASDALYNAALWNEGLGNFEKAIGLYNEYIAHYGNLKGGIAPDTLAFNIVLIHEKLKDWPNTEKALDAYLKTYEKSVKPSEAFYARYKRAVVLQKLSRNDEAMKIFEVLYKEFPKLKPEEQKKIDYLDAYAHAAFMLLEPRWKAYQAIKFNNVRNLKKDLQAKLTATPILIDDYTKVLAIGSADWGIAALTRIGMINQDFARNFVDSPDPPGLDPDQLDMYRSELENRAFPLEDKAVEAFEKATGKSYELGIYNEYTLAAQDALNKFKPNTYGEVRTVSFTGSEFFSGAEAALAVDQSFGGSKLQQMEIQKPEGKTETAKDGKSGAKPDVQPAVAKDGKDAAEGEEPAPAAEPEAPKKPKLILDQKPSAQK